LSDYRDWEQWQDVEALVYPENFGLRMSIDETCLHKGELYTVITNKEAKGQKGSLAALIKGTKNEVVTKSLSQVPLSIRMGVTEITADLANNMDWICRTNFMCATLVADRFHVQTLVHEAVQELRILERRKAIDEDNQLEKAARVQGRHYDPFRYENGDTKKQLLARSRYLLFKPQEKWTESQRIRSEILFREFPTLDTAYVLSMQFRAIFENKSLRKEEAVELIKTWSLSVKASKLATLISATQTVMNNLGKIVNYFENRATNAGAESFNAKLKGFRDLLRGIRDPSFFLYRVEKLFS
jgi:transposase